jgi:hypothetical protein
MNRNNNTGWFGLEPFGRAISGTLAGGILFWSACHARATITPGAVLSWGGGQPSPASPLTNATAISVAMDHTLALLADGTISARGHNFDGQCSVPGGLNNITAVAAGAFFSVALRADGTVIVWGDNQFNQAEIPADATNIVAISAGRGHVLALKANGTVQAWGSDIFSQTDVPTGLSSVVSVFANWNYSLALRSDGTVVAWGIDDAGQTEVPSGLANVKAVTGNMEYCVALKSDGTIVTWGKAPTPPPGLSGVISVAAGENHCLALTSAGTIVAWGGDSSGQSDVPSAATRPSSLGAGWNYSVALIAPDVVAGPFSLRDVNWTGATFSASVATQPNQTYVLQYKGSASDSSWISLAPAQGTGQGVRLIDSTATNAHRIYRVRQL